MTVEELIEQLRYHDDEAVVTNVYGDDINFIYEEDEEIDGESKTVVVLG